MMDDALTIQTALQHASMAVMIYDADDRIRFVNHAAGRILDRLGFLPERTGRRWPEILPHLADSSYPDLLEQARRSPVGQGPSLPVFEAIGRHRLTLRHLGDRRVAAFFEPIEEIQEARAAIDGIREERDAIVRLYPFGSIASFDDDPHFRAE